MTMEISRLGIEVTSTGIREASAALGGLSTVANNADKRVASLTTNLGNLMRVSGSTIGNMSGLSGTMALINQAMQSASANAAAMAQAMALATRGMDNLDSATRAATRSYQSHNHHGGVVTTTLKAMTTAALAYFSIRSVRGLVDQSDAWGMMQAKLKLATGSMESAKFAQQELFNMAQNLRAPLEDMGKLYTRLAPALARMGKSSQDTRDMVEGVALALKLGGATAGEAASTMLQFSQAANSGRLNGAEFNSVAENGVMILRALEDHLGKNQAELKKMGADGKLTFDIISEAMAAALPKMREDFKSLPMTFEDAMTRLKNAWFKAVGEIGQNEQIGKKLSEAVLKLEDDIPRIVEALMTAFTFLIDNGKAVAAVIAGIVGLGVAKWGLEAAAAFTTVAAATTKATGAVRVLQVAMGFLGGPIGIITALLAAGVTTWALWGNSGETAEQNLTKTTRLNVDARIKELNREIEKLEARNLLAGAKPSDPNEPKRSAHAKQQMADIEALRAKIAGPMDPQARVAAQFKLNAMERDYLALINLENRERELLAKKEQEGRDKRKKELNEQAEKHFGTPAQKAALQIKEWEEKYKALGEEMPEWLKKAIEETKTHAGAKAIKQAAKELKEAQEHAKHELANALTAYNEALAAYGDAQASPDGKDKRTHAEKELAKVQNELTAMEGKKLSVEQQKIKNDLEATRAAWDKIVQIEAQTKAVLDQKTAAAKADEEYKKSIEDYSKKQEASIEATDKEYTVLQDKINAFGQAKGAVDSLALSEAVWTLSQMDSMNSTEAQIAQQTRLVAALEKVQNAKKTLGQLELEKKLNDELDALKPADFGNGFAEAFGSVGKAIDKAGKSLDQYNKKMNHLAKLREEAAGLDDEKKRSKALEKIQKAELNANLDMYADMAGAMKGFFKEKTVAYKAFDAIEKGLRIARLAADAEEFAIKIAQGAQWIAAKVSQAYTAMTTDTAVTTASVANSEVSAAASTTAGVAKAFEQLGVWGFVGAAAIIAFMASMGVSGGGGGASGGLIGPDGKIETLEQRQKRQGTGTVLGDDAAKSESIKNSLDRMKDNSNVGLIYTAGMLAALRNIEANIGGLTGNIASVTGMTTGKNFNVKTGTQSHGGLGGLFGGKTTTSIEDTGLQLNGTIATLLGGKAGVSQYLDILTESKSGGFLGIGSKTSTSHTRQYRDVDEDTIKTIGAIFNDINSSIVDAAVALGGSASQIKTQLDKFIISTEVSFKDLKGDDLEKALNEVFSATADQMASQVFGGFKQFQKAGEGYYETLLRVASGSERANDALSKLGVGMIDLKDVSNKGADVAAELVRQSLMKKEAGTSLADILSLLDGSMEDLIDGYKELTRIRDAMQTTGLGSNISLALIRGAGGLSELTSAFDDYLDGFFSDAEKQRIALSKVRMEFGRLNVAVPASKEAFKALVQSLMAGDETSQELAGRILALSGEFADAIDKFDDQRKEKIDKAKDSLSDAYDKEAEALENVRDKMKDFASSLKDFHDSLLTGDLSTKSELEKYQTALAKYNDVTSKALSGDKDAIEQYQKAAEEFLGFSRKVNASGAGYTADYERVLAESQTLQQYTQVQADAATQSLDLLKKQVDGLIELNKSVKTVAQAIDDLHAAMAMSLLAESNASTAQSVYQAINPATAAPVVDTAKVVAVAEAAAGLLARTSNSGDLLTALTDLNAKVAQLTEEQRKQTAAIIDANYDANAQNADAVVNATKDAAQDTAYATRNINLN